MGGHRFRPMGFSPHSNMVIRAVARDWSFISFPRVFFSLNVFSNTSCQLLIYPVGEIPELSAHSLHPRSSGKKNIMKRPMGMCGLRSAQSSWGCLVSCSSVKRLSSSDSGKAEKKQGPDEQAFAYFLEGTRPLPGCGRFAVLLLSQSSPKL